jgi:hypothetical protein
MSEKNMSCRYNENFEFLINELSESQKLQSKTINDLVTSVNSLREKINKIEEYLINRKEAAPTIDTNPLQEIVKKAMAEIKMMLLALPKNTSKKIQILLFPEQDAKLFYKIVFGRWFMWLAIMLFLTLAYKWMIHREDNNKQMIIEAWKNEKIIKAWDYLYSQKNKNLHRLMDTALIRAAEQRK